MEMMTDIENERLQDHRRRVSEFTKERIKRDDNKKLEELFINFVNNIELTYDEQEGARKFLKYMKES